MPIFTAMTTLGSAETAAQLGLALERLRPEPVGICVLEVEDGKGVWEVGGYFTARPDPAGLALLSLIHEARDFVVSKLDNRDWVAQVQRELTPVEAGRFIVHGSHDADKVPENRIGLHIEAAMAFGTGHHATTMGCLLALDGLAKAGLLARHVADIGTGTGVLAMAAAKLWPARIVASDIDPVATATARANMVANGVGGRVRCLTSVGFSNRDLRAAGPFDLIMANILAGPLHKMAPEMAAHAAPGARLILSGLLTRQAPRIEAVYKSWGMVRARRIVIGEWTTLVLRNPG